MPAEGTGISALDPLPRAFLDQLAGHEELLVSSRDRSGVGSVRMWFAVVPPGFIYLLTPTYTLKAERWREDPWVRFRVPDTEVALEAVVMAVGWDEAKPSAAVLTTSFAMAGAATSEALRWMLKDGSRQLLRAGIRRRGVPEGATRPAPGDAG